MQIRVANRQDEPIIRNIIGQTKIACGQPELDLTGGDADLMNIEAHYFWNDGLFVVAEEDGTIVGLAGARRGGSEDTLELARLVVISSRPDVDLLGSQLLDLVEFFAGNAGYSRILLDKAGVDVENRNLFGSFTQDGSNSGRWSKPVKSRQFISGNR